MSAFISGVSFGVNGRSVHASSICRRGSVMMAQKVYQVRVELDGKDYTVPVGEDETFLEALENQGLSVDSSCRAGVCMTCAAKLEAGKVDIGEAALADEVKEAGFVLTCSAFPRSEGIKLKMQEFDDAYDMQYGQYEKESQEKAEKEKKSGFLSGLFGNK